MAHAGHIRNLALTVSVLVAASVALTACGRKGPLERPAAAKEAARNQTQAADATVRGPDKPFIFDRLLR